MKKIYLFVALFLQTQSYAQIDTAFYLEEARVYQDDLNHEYKSAETTPLSKEDLAKFKSLDFFPLTSEFIVEASFEKYKKKQLEILQTSTSRMPAYKVYGILRFEINGAHFELTLYQNPDFKNNPDLKDHLFLPFTDLTSGESTYGGGRYLDFYIPKSDKVVLNFNKAYNPYCAVSDRYSCPVPPKNNFLNIEILAGVKMDH